MSTDSIDLIRLNITLTKNQPIPNHLTRLSLHVKSFDLLQKNLSVLRAVLMQSFFDIHSSFFIYIRRSIHVICLSAFDTIKTANASIKHEDFSLESTSNGRNHGKF